MNTEAEETIMDLRDAISPESASVEDSVNIARSTRQHLHKLAESTDLHIFELSNALASAIWYIREQEVSGRISGATPLLRCFEKTLKEHGVVSV